MAIGGSRPRPDPGSGVVSLVHRPVVIASSESGGPVGLRSVGLKGTAGWVRSGGALSRWDRVLLIASPVKGSILTGDHAFWRRFSGKPRGCVSAEAVCSLQPLEYVTNWLEDGGTDARKSLLDLTVLGTARSLLRERRRTYSS